jgi:hypothetical protein
MAKSLGFRAITGGIPALVCSESAAVALCKSVADADAAILQQMLILRASFCNQDYAQRIPCECG